MQLDIKNIPLKIFVIALTISILESPGAREMKKSDFFSKK